MRSRRGTLANRLGTCRAWRRRAMPNMRGQLLRSAALRRPLYLCAPEATSVDRKRTGRCGLPETMHWYSAASAGKRLHSGARTSRHILRFLSISHSIQQVSEYLVQTRYSGLATAGPEISPTKSTPSSAVTTLWATAAGTVLSRAVCCLSSNACRAHGSSHSIPGCRNSGPCNSFRISDCLAAGSPV
eukprot:SAG22_NODE_56_length_23716_cov_11.146759_19_plen_187_part_00